MSAEGIVDMSDRLMPYGSSRNAGLVAKVGTPKIDGKLLPYGSGRFASLTVKRGGQKIEDDEVKRVTRLNRMAR